MGAWGYEPWEDDMAADWYIDMFSHTKLAEFVEKALRQGESYFEKTRAAAYVLIALGKPGLWPGGRLESDLKLALDAMQEAYDSGVAYNNEGFTEALEKEISMLQQQLTEAQGDDPDLDED